MKNDQNKPPYQLLPWAEMDEIAQVFAYGAEKYKVGNWKELNAGRLIAAAIRHLSLYQQGQTHDAESGMNHLAHVTTSTLMALWHSNHSEPTGKGKATDLMVARLEDRGIQLRGVRVGFPGCNCIICRGDDDGGC